MTDFTRRRQLVQAVLDRQGAVFLHIDPQRNAFDCLIPRHLKISHYVRLLIGVGCVPPVDDLSFDDKGIAATLAFSGVRIYCSIPWECVLAATGPDGSGFAWDDAMDDKVNFRDCIPDAAKGNVISLDEYRRRRAAEAP